MNETNGLSPAVDKALQQVWDVLCRILLKRGIDLNDRVERWVQNQRSAFRNPQTIIDFDELCAHGCHAPMLALLLLFITNADELVMLWANYVAEPKTRKSTSKILEAAAAALEETFAIIIALEDDEVRRELPEVGRIPLSVLISELRLYSNLLALGRILKVEAETRSPAELARFLLTYYVERATGRPHDRNMSTLLTEAQNLVFYDEVAQRMWRDRNYKRLARHHLKLGELAFVIGTIVRRRT